MIYTRGKSKIDGPADIKYRTKYELPLHAHTRARLLSTPVPFWEIAMQYYYIASARPTPSRRHHLVSQRPIHPRAARLHSIPRVIRARGVIWKRLQVSAAADAVPYQTYQRPAIYYYARGRIRLYPDITIIVLRVIPTVFIYIYKTYVIDVRNVFFFFLHSVARSVQRNITICTRVLQQFTIDVYGLIIFTFLLFRVERTAFWFLTCVSRGSAVQRNCMEFRWISPTFGVQLRYRRHRKNVQTINAFWKIWRKPIAVKIAFGSGTWTQRDRLKSQSSPLLRLC